MNLGDEIQKTTKEILRLYGEGKLVSPLYTENIKISDYKQIFKQKDENTPSKRVIFVGSDH